MKRNFNNKDRRSESNRSGMSNGQQRDMPHREQQEVEDRCRNDDAIEAEAQEVALRNWFLLNSRRDGGGRPRTVRDDRGADQVSFCAFEDFTIALLFLFTNTP
jgi:hypothetical protein